jgi:hypothetical protein
VLRGSRRPARARVVRLGWRWSRRGRPLPGGEAADLGVSVLPGQSHEFRASITLPREPGTYVLELGLVSEHVAWFDERGRRRSGWR